MKTVYTSASKDAIATAQIMLEDKYMKVLLTNEPDMIDTIVCTIDSITPDTLLIMHTTHCTWATDPDWKKEHPNSGSGDHPAGYMCRHCHEPVYCYVAANEDTGLLRHVRYLCGCTMLLMSPEMGPWWSEINCPEFWNDIIVPGAKRAHKVHGVK
jgi:hypothetical protein